MAGPDAAARRYRLQRWFVLRMTGFPVEQLTALRAPGLAAACARNLAAEAAFDAATEALLAALRPLGPEARVARDHARRRRPIEVTSELASLEPLVVAYETARASLTASVTALTPAWEEALAEVRPRLYARVRDERFRHALLLGSPGVERIEAPDPSLPLPDRNTTWRSREQTWISYLQRFTTKNESISFFGPSVWGRVDEDGAPGIDIELDDSEIDRRVAYYEQWVCDAIAAIAAVESKSRATALPVTPKPFDELRRRLGSEPRWPANLARLDELRAEFEQAPAAEPRRRILGEIEGLLSEWGVRPPRKSKSLYAARLPLNEDCRRAARRVTIGPRFVAAIERDLAPWLELWRDLASLWATRLYDALAPPCRELGPRPRLDEVLAATAAAGLPLGKSGGQGLLAALDDEIQTAWSEQLGARASQAEVALTDDDLTFVRRRFTLRRMRDGDLPAPDVQLATPDAARARAGDGLVILGEVHPDFTPWQHALSVFCPELAAVAAEHRAHHGPGFFFGRHLSELGAHSALPRAEMGGFVGVAPFAPAGVPSIDAADVRVEVSDDDLVAVRSDGTVLGSLLHTWNVALNTHGLELLGTGTHAPRLTVGRVVVQRESFTVTPDARVHAEVKESGPALALGVHRLRTAFRLPSEVFVRPLLAHRITLHKDAKPFFVDFDNPLLVELFAVAIRGAHSLRITEALPRLEDCWLANRLGRYSFELRTIAVPSDRRASLSGALEERTQASPVDLAPRRLRDRVDEDQPLWALVGGELAACVRDELGRRRALAFLEDDARADLLAEDSVLEPDRVGLGDGWVREERAIDLGRIDVETGADDELLDAAEQEDAPLGIDVAVVAGAKPTVA